MVYIYVYLIGFCAFVVGMPVYLLLSRNGTRYDNMDIAFGTLLSSLFWPLSLIFFAIYRFSVGLRWYEKNVINVQKNIAKNNKAYQCAIDLLSKVPAESYSYKKMSRYEKVGIETANGIFWLTCTDGGKSWTVSIRNIDFDFEKSRFFFRDELKLFEKVLSDVRKIRQSKDYKKFEELHQEILNSINS